MTCLFSDIYDGIRCLRVMKGASEKEILDFVKQRAGNMQVGNMLKTIRTLRKLVDDGILTKKGKRYSFTGKPPKAECYDSEDNECEDEDDDDEDDDDDEYGMNDDDDDDDDDDGCGFENEGFCDVGDDDDDDDDDLDENKQCDGKNTVGTDKKSLMKETSPKGSFILRPRVGEGKCGTTEKQENSNSTAEHTGEGESAPDKTEKKAVIVKKKRSDQEPAENEAPTQGSAFCVRDFIDSLVPSKMEEMPDNLIQVDLPREKPNSREGFQKMQKRKVERSRLKRSRAAHCSYRSRSPLYGRKSELYNRLQLNLSNDFGPSSLVFQEPTDDNRDVEMKEKPEVKDNDVQRQTKSEGASRFEATKSQNEKPAPCDSSKNLQELMKKEASPEKGPLGVNIPLNKAAPLAVDGDSQTIWAVEGKDGKGRRGAHPQTK